MKHYLISLLLILCSSSFGQRVELATSISPADLGAHKWVLSGTPSENEVVIFRFTRVRVQHDTTFSDVYDRVYYSPDEQQTATAFFFDPNFFDAKRTTEPTWSFQAFGSTGWITGKYTGECSRTNHAEIKFESKNGTKTTMTFETLIKPYNEAALWYDKLPDIKDNSDWCWAGFPVKETSK